MDKKISTTYYYANGRPANEDVEAPTTFIKRPEDPDGDEIDQPRKT